MPPHTCSITRIRGRAPLDRLIAQPRTQVGELPGLYRVQGARLLAHAWITQIGKVGVADLQVIAPGQVRDLGGVGAGEIGEEKLDSGVGLFINRRAAAAEVQHGGGGNSDLRGHGADWFQVPELVGEEGPDLGELAGDFKTMGLQLEPS